MKDSNTPIIKPVPNQNQKLTAGHKRKDIPPASVVAIGVNDEGDSLGGISYSPLTGAKSEILEVGVRTHIRL